MAGGAPIESLHLMQRIHEGKNPFAFGTALNQSMHCVINISFLEAASILPVKWKDWHFQTCYGTGFHYNLWQEAACPLPRKVMLLKASALQPQNYHFHKQRSAIYQEFPCISFKSHHGLLKLKFLFASVSKKTFDAC